MGKVTRLLRGQRTMGTVLPGPPALLTAPTRLMAPLLMASRLHLTMDMGRHHPVCALHSGIQPIIVLGSHILILPLRATRHLLSPLGFQANLRARLSAPLAFRSRRHMDTLSHLRLPSLSTIRQITEGFSDLFRPQVFLYTPLATFRRSMRTHTPHTLIGAARTIAMNVIRNMNAGVAEEVVITIGTGRGMDMKETMPTTNICTIEITVAEETGMDRSVGFMTGTPNSHRGAADSTTCHRADPRACKARIVLARAFRDRTLFLPLLRAPQPIVAVHRTTLSYRASLKMSLAMRKRPLMLPLRKHRLKLRVTLGPSQMSK